MGGCRFTGGSGKIVEDVSLTKTVDPVSPVFPYRRPPWLWPSTQHYAVTWQGCLLPTTLRSCEQSFCLLPHHLTTISSLPRPAKRAWSLTSVTEDALEARRWAVELCKPLLSSITPPPSIQSLPWLLAGPVFEHQHGRFQSEAAQLTISLEREDNNLNCPRTANISMEAGKSRLASRQPASPSFKLSLRDICSPRLSRLSSRLAATSTHFHPLPARQKA